MKGKGVWKPLHLIGDTWASCLFPRLGLECQTTYYSKAETSRIWLNHSEVTWPYPRPYTSRMFNFVRIPFIYRIILFFSMLSSFSVFFPATRKEIDAFESQQKKGGVGMLSNPSKIYANTDRKHPLFFGRGWGGEAQFFSCHEVVVLPIWLIQIFFVDDLQPSCRGWSCLSYRIFWKVCEAGVVELLFLGPNIPSL